MKKKFKKIIVHGLKLCSRSDRCPECGSSDLVVVRGGGIETEMRCRNCGRTFTIRRND